MTYFYLAVLQVRRRMLLHDGPISMSNNIVFAAAAAVVFLAGIFLLHILVIVLYRRFVNPVLHTCLELPKFEFSLFALLLVALSYYTAGVFTSWMHDEATLPACIIAVVVIGVLLLPYYTFKCWIAIGSVQAMGGSDTGMFGPHWHSFHGVLDTRTSAQNREATKGLDMLGETAFPGPHWQVLHHAPGVQSSKAVAEGQEVSQHQAITRRSPLLWLWPSQQLFVFFAFLFDDVKVRNQAQLWQKSDYLSVVTISSCFALHRSQAAYAGKP
jgi:hypothetical protein